jgi:predicted lysophospholipase L1 biosynthesis ABC-type transport system permease subunit
VISESLAGRLFGRDQAVGRLVWMGAGAPPAEIVGVAGDVKHRALDEPVAPTVYLSAWQSSSRSRHVIVRSARPDADVLAAVRDEVARLDANLPVYGVGSMTETVSGSPGVPARRLLTATFVAFATVALALGAIGLFGAVAHDVARRRSELALRIALGADSRRIVRATLRQGAFMVGTGLAAGVVLSFWAARALRTVLFAADRLDVLSAGIAAALLVAASVVAVLPAALRAARIDPLTALRAE